MRPAPLGLRTPMTPSVGPFHTARLILPVGVTLAMRIEANVAGDRHGRGGAGRKHRRRDPAAADSCAVT